MRASFTFLLCVFLASAARAAYHCIDFFIPVTITAPSHQVAFPPFQNHSEAVSFLVAHSSRDPPAASTIFKDVVNVTQTFNISARYCQPSGVKPTTVQLLSHGLGFDKVYWEFGGPQSEYNYVKAATEAGYATFAYDRLGTGQSSKPDPYGLVQASIEVAVLTSLTGKLRDGVVCPDVPKPEAVLHVSHSWGSQITYGMLITAPGLTDGVVLTAFSTNGTWQPLPAVSSVYNLASDNQPARFANYSSGYITWSGAGANQYWFFHFPNFDAAVLAEAEATKWPFTIGEEVTGSLLSGPAPGFTGPILVSHEYLETLQVFIWGVHAKS